MQEVIAGVPVVLRGGPGVPDSGPTAVCRAPSASMYFDPRGKVRSCCQSRGGYLGDVTTSSLRDIWEGAEIQSARVALEQGRFPSSCAFCAWQVREGDHDVLFARTFDHLPEPTTPARRWPLQMEFALTNTCNLRCVMCSGDYSSAIRAQREGRPPMAAVYGEDFFEQLGEFLPHLEEARFYGGEPLLGREPMRVLEMLAQLRDRPRTTLTTNATVWSPRVERVLGELRPHLVASLDGATAAVFEQIRPGARFDQVMANVERYRSLVGPHRFSLTTCLMVENVHEFVDLLNLSSSWQVHLGVNVVHHPLRHSLYARPAGALADAVALLESRRDEVATDRLEIFDGQVAALRNRLEAVRSIPDDRASMAGLPLASYLLLDERATSRWGWLPFAEDGPLDDGGRFPDAAADAEVHVFELGTDGVVGLSGPSDLLPASLRDLAGRPVEDLQDLLIEAFGAMEGWHLVEDASGPELRVVRPGGALDNAAVLSMSARRDERQRLIGASYQLQLRPAARARLDRRQSVPG